MDATDHRAPLPSKMSYLGWRGLQLKGNLAVSFYRSRYDVHPCVYIACVTSLWVARGDFRAVNKRLVNWDSLRPRVSFLALPACYRRPGRFSNA
jgi:hypothetical protein